MQQFITIFLTIIYLLFSTGISVSKHFCGTELASIEFYGEAEKCACGANAEEDTEENNSCCKDETKIFKTNNDLKSSFDFDLGNNVNDNLFGNLLLVVPLNFGYKTEFIQFFTNFSSKIRLIPKIPLQKNPFWLVFRVLRI
jgi:hypothetical protein